MKVRSKKEPNKNVLLEKQKLVILNMQIIIIFYGIFLYNKSLFKNTFLIYSLFKINRH